MMGLDSVISINLMNPSAWWGLLGLLVPFTIHLLSKKEKTIVPFGSLQFLKSTESNSARSVQLSEVFLLFLRCLMIGIVTAILVEPFTEIEKERTSYWVEEAVYNNPDYTDLVENIPSEELHIFSHNNQDTSRIRYFKSAWTLINHVNRLADSSIVYSHSLQNNFIGNPVLLDNRVKWNIIPMKESALPSEIFSNGNQAVEWNIIPEATALSVESKTVATDAQPTLLKLKLLPYGDEKSARKLKEVIDLTEEYLTYSIKWLNEDHDGSDIEIIIGKDNNLRTQNKIQWLPSNHQLNTSLKKDNELVISGKIDRESIIDADLPVKVAAFFNNYMTAIKNQDVRIMLPRIRPLEEISNDSNNILIANPEQRPLSKYLLVVLIPLFILERFISLKSNRT